ncbi:MULTISPECIES: DNA repair helicase XPB [unclassified Pseudoclavibacter]|uniref:DNA repair helicase XPB n=1 Tax=unclassified Pseudoclavibacter TaxID=2615177 RepID=UPI0013019290|nr:MULTISPECIES: DNA repair helicase XPB [unclassified Pseudoclavibacter]KAB1647283.1 DEAD/DEAH box helicase [Pseudoclavibacter sp. CFCC 14310]KAB1662724.1 DEAD/DEAH box helicase [Pseudoclavibacter sp. CFCC 13611]
MGPLIVQSDRTVLLELDHPDANAARQAIGGFAELERAPEHVHTYRITRMGLWNAAAAGVTADEIISALNTYAKFAVPDTVVRTITDAIDRYGRLDIIRDSEGRLVLTADDARLLTDVANHKRVAALLTEQVDQRTWIVQEWARGQLKQELLRIGWPAEDHAGYTDGDPYEIDLNEDDWHLRPYQQQAVDSFVAGGSGVVVLPCGAGKTIVGAGAMAALSRKTLILVTNTLAAHQWRDELLRRTRLTDEQIGEYSGEAKIIAPVTIATYQMLTARRSKKYTHLSLLDAENWGLIVYDEVHLLPAPIFKLTAELQARRRLGLTATLVREDGKESDVFSLIGPKRYEAPWRDIEAQGFISPADCVEVRVEFTEDEQARYAMLADAERYHATALAEAKLDTVAELLDEHADDQTLVIGQYLDQLELVAERTGLPLITGKTPTPERERLFAAFRTGEQRALIVSKVANFSVDLPDARVAIQISGAFGSRQEEAQRLGRIIRPNSDGSRSIFYSIVVADTVDQDYALSRQRFLSEQGYSYRIVDAEDLPVSIPA